MRTRDIILTAALALAAPIARAQSEPAAFVKAHFPEATIVSSVKDGKETETRLSDHTVIEFDARHAWEEIDCRRATTYKEVPEALLPEAVKAFTRSLYPQARVVKASRDKKGWEVETDGRVEIEFDARLEWTEVDCEHATPRELPPALLPEAVEALLAAQYPQGKAVKVSRTKKGWEVELSDGTELKFRTDLSLRSVER